MSISREVLEGFVKRVSELAEHVKGNEQATKQSLIGPFFTLLGYDLTDPRECMPEYKVDFGKERSTKPIDWAFKTGGGMAFFVEAKEVGKKLAGYDEQLADYFAKDPNVRVGILTNGAHWRFFTDMKNANVMDREPFAVWDVLGGEVPYDLITLLEKSNFNPDLVRSYALKELNRSLIIQELNRVLDPSNEFTKLAIANLETRNLTSAVVESWRPIVANALLEWARQRTVSAVLSGPNGVEASTNAEAAKVTTTPEELDGFAAIRRVLGAERPIAHTDSSSYFKVHHTGHPTWVFARLFMDRKNRTVAVPLPLEQVQSQFPARAMTHAGGWTSIAVTGAADIAELAPVLIEAFTVVAT